MKPDLQAYDYIRGHEVPRFFPAFYDISKTVKENYANLEKICSKTQEYNRSSTYLIYGPFENTNQCVEVQEKHVKDVTTWVFKNIITKLDFMNYVTLAVLLRIATGMLDKTYLSREHKILFHDNMVNNINREFTKTIDEDLPF